MEKNANYATVGLTTLILTVAMIVFVVWLGRLSFARDFDLYDIVFQGPVRGLNEGGEVHFNGIKVGEVTKIGLDKVNPRNVIARVRVAEDVPIRGDSYATLEPQGITGLNYVQISPGTATRPLLKDVASARCEKLGRDCVPILGSPGQDGAGLASLREVIQWEVGFAPPACRKEAVHGLVLISLADGPGAARLVLGGGAWRWSDLLGLRRGG